MKRPLNVCAAVVFLLIGLLVWQRTVGQQQPAPEEAVPSRSTVASTDDLGGQDRYLSYLSTDKPLYRPGETLFARAVMLHHASRRPVPSSPEGAIRAVAQVIGPQGEPLASGMVTAEDSVFGWNWPIPAEVAGGEYTLRISYPESGHPPAQRKFDIRVYRAPRITTQIQFLREGYGPGDVVVATLEVKRSEGGIPAGAGVRITARVDGQEVFHGDGQVDPTGRCGTRFKLPANIQRGQGSLAMAVEDGGVVETATKSIPILLRTVDLAMYPEGGELIAGVVNRVYFEALTPTRKPADLSGVVLDQEGKEVCRFESEHEGRGRFSFVPQPAHSYRLRITEPAGIEQEFPLPEPKPVGLTMRSTKDAYDATDAIELELLAALPLQDISVTLSHRERELAQAQPRIADQQSAGRVQFRLPQDAPSGVLVATAWDREGKPLAERLLFRKPAGNVRISLSSDRTRYVPGGKSKVQIRTTNLDGDPVAAIVGVTITDDSVLQMIERREQAPRLPAMVLLESDVRELADADIYFNDTDPRAGLAVDLLLGTQGWRRFATLNVPAFVSTHQEQALQALAIRRGGRIPGLELHAQSKLFLFLDGLQQNEHDEFFRGRWDERSRNRAFFARGDLNGRDKNDEAARELAQLGAGGGRFALDAEAFFKRQRFGGIADLESRVRNDFGIVRVYAHQVRPDRVAGQRVDFTETLFWHAGIKTDASGRADVEFGLNDSVTSFRVLADAFTGSGELGQASTLIESVEPFYVEPKLPLEMTMGDRVQAPIAVVNSTDSALQAEISAQSPQLGVDTKLPALPLQADNRGGRWLNFAVNDYLGPAELTISAAAGEYNDQVTRSVNVRPFGFPEEIGNGGLLAPNSVVSQVVTIPGDVVPSSLRAKLAVYPTPLANMTAALERLIQEPSGCFEQTSSTVYPLVMAQQYFMSHTGVDASLIERSDKTLETGYQRLLGFECPGGGFEWFGRDPGHDGLTAYGLLEFSEMAQVRSVDPAMLDRTRRWLLDQRDGHGGYVRRATTLHCWLPDPEISATYNTWALLSAGFSENLEAEVRYARMAGENSDNTYVAALAANVLQLAGDQDGVQHLLDKLAGKQTSDGWLDGSTTSVVGSGGEALQIETTALAVTAWLRDDRFAGNVERAIKWLAESCQSGRFGSTQSTILALKAIVAYDQARANPKAPGSLQLTVDGQPVGEPIPFTPQTQGVIELPDISSRLAAGQHRIELRMIDGSQMPYSLGVQLHRTTPASSAHCPLHLEVSLNDATAREGSATEAKVVLVNRGDKQLPSPVAIIGTPGGLEVDHQQLKELVKQQTIDAYEVRGRELVLYWRAIDGEQRREVPIRLVANIPGSYTAPASRAYLYYMDEHKTWVEGLSARITTRDLSE